MPIGCFRACFGGIGASGSGGKKKNRNQVTPEQEVKLRNLEKVLKELECPICFHTCIPPIFTCINGHMICSKCKKNVTLCPTCREDFANTRCLFAEQFIEQYSQSCRYVKEGCKFLRWKGEDMKPHEKLCDYRLLRCIVPSCQNLVPYQLLLKHLMELHKIKGSEDIPVTISFNMLDDEPPLYPGERKWLPYYIKAFGCTFYVMFEIIRPFFHIWVWVHCPKAEASEKIRFLTGLRFENTKTLSLEWRGPVYPIRVSPTLIVRDGPCFAGSDSLLEHFEHDGNIYLTVDIEKIYGNSEKERESSISNLNPTESTLLDTGDREREMNFSELLIAASSQLIGRSSATVNDRRNNNNNNNSPQPKP